MSRVVADACFQTLADPVADPVPVCIPGRRRGGSGGGTPATTPATAGATAAPAARVGAPKLLLAHKWERARHNPVGWWISEKLDGVRALWDGSKRCGGGWVRVH